MKTSLLRSLVAVAAVSATVAAHAQSSEPRLYGEIGYTQARVELSDGGGAGRFSSDLLTGTVGYRLHPQLAVEGLVGFGLGGDRIKGVGLVPDARGKLVSTLGVFVRPSVQLSDSIELFGRLGLVNSKVKVSGGGASDADSDTGLAYGIGANFNLSKSSYLQAGWTSFYDDDRDKVRGIGLAWGMKF